MIKQKIYFNFKLTSLLLIVTYITLSGQGFSVYDDIFNSETEKVQPGNVDGDSLPDVVYNDQNSVGISLNIGANFEQINNIEIYQSSNPIRQIEVVDFNLDGFDDVLVLEEDYSSLVLLENSGFGDFSSKLLIDSCAVRDFQVIDINGDGNLDIIGATHSNRDVYTDQELIFYKNKNNEEFTKIILNSKQAYFVSDLIRFIDIDKDGDLDILYHYCISGWNIPVPPPFYDEYLLFTQNEPGVFESKLIKQYGLSCADIQVADMNSDGLLDLVITTMQNTTGYDNIIVAFQKAGLEFDFKDISPEDKQYFNKDGVGFDLIDINLDGNLDIVYRLAGIRIALNKGNKNFQDKVLIPKESDKYLREFEVRDFDNDGLEDILITYNSTGLLGAPKTWVLYKMTDRNLLSFEKRDSIYQESENEYGLWHIIDIDQDGFLDVLGDRGRSFIFHNLNKTNSINDPNNSKLENITIYPNPASDFINIDLKDMEDTRAIIYNKSGQIVKTFDHDEIDKDLDVSDLIDGIYYVKVLDDKGVIYGYEKLIKTSTD